MHTQALVITWATPVFLALIALQLLLYRFCCWLHRGGGEANSFVGHARGTSTVQRRLGGAPYLPPELRAITNLTKSVRDFPSIPPA
ncbi:MAG TPA: hypothetical protein VMV87_00605 [Burkholderiales bacterium]|nr:hypothetical protein [Burkholderiales bacterium]